MKKFLFRLETLLQHRHNIEERERTKFSTLRYELLVELDRVRMLRTKQAQILAELALKKSGVWDFAEIEWHCRFLDRLSQEIECLAKKIAELEGKLEMQKQVMVEAMRDKKTIENLKEKSRKEFLTSVERIEQKSTDELVVTRHALKS
jgi:flagellar protein FliJ